MRKNLTPSIPVLYALYRTVYKRDVKLNYLYLKYSLWLPVVNEVLVLVALIN
jgi:hypothetical protein